MNINQREQIILPVCPYQPLSLLSTVPTLKIPNSTSYQGTFRGNKHHLVFIFHISKHIHCIRDLLCLHFFCSWYTKCVWSYVQQYLNVTQNLMHDACILCSCSAACLVIFVHIYSQAKLSMNEEQQHIWARTTHMFCVHSMCRYLLV